MRLAIATLLVAAAVAGCGGDDGEQSSATPAAAPSAATDTPTPAETETPSATPTATEQPQPSVAPEDQEGGAGDEEPTRVPVEFTISDGKIAPPQVAVPAFLALELIVHNESSQQVVVRLEGAEPMTLAAGDSGRARLEGRKKGYYVVDAGDAGQAVLVTGAEPGP